MLWRLTLSLHGRGDVLWPRDIYYRTPHLAESKIKLRHIQLIPSQRNKREDKVYSANRHNINICVAGNVSEQIYDSIANYIKYVAYIAWRYIFVFKISYIYPMYTYTFLVMNISIYFNLQMWLSIGSCSRCFQLLGCSSSMHSVCLQLTASVDMVFTKFNWNTDLETIIEIVKFWKVLNFQK